VQVLLSFCPLMFFLPPDVGHCTGSVLSQVVWVARSPVTASTVSVMCGRRMQTPMVWLVLCMMQGRRAGCQSFSHGVAAVHGRGIMTVLLLVLVLVLTQLPIVACTGLWGCSVTWAAAKA
jgi:hypothetical protein